MQRRRLNRSAAARPSRQEPAGRAALNADRRRCRRQAFVPRASWLVPPWRRRPGDARSSCATACAMSVWASVRTRG